MRLPLVMTAVMVCAVAEFVFLSESEIRTQTVPLAGKALVATPLLPLVNSAVLGVPEAAIAARIGRAPVPSILHADLDLYKKPRSASWTFRHPGLVLGPQCLVDPADIGTGQGAVRDQVAEPTAAGGGPPPALPWRLNHQRPSLFL